MCGILGLINFNKDQISDTLQIQKMNNKVVHRGPNNSGYWHNNQKSIYFAHRRLSILDLSNNGSQPMLSSKKNKVIIYNGEIYNYLEIKNEIEKFRQKKNLTKISWHSKSDTEILLSAIDHFGLRTTLDIINGMFAFAFYDIEKNELYLARDIFGQKPLYYGFIDNYFIFLSDLLSLNEFRKFNKLKNISDVAIEQFLKYSCVPQPLSIYKNFNKLNSGNYLSLNLDNNKSLKIYEYYSIKKNILNIKKKSTKKSFENTLLNLDLVINKSVKRHMISDVPIGSLLSGGVDSSLISAIMQKNSSQKIKTFNVGFANKEFDESIYAEKIAKEIGTKHSTIIVNEQNIIDLIPEIVDAYSEPFADSSQLPSMIIFKIISKNINVVLTGDGGDELFCGYNRYLAHENLFLKINKLNPFLKKNLYLAYYLFPKKFILFFNKIMIFLNPKYSVPDLQNKLIKLFYAFDSEDSLDFYLKIIDQFPDSKNIFLKKDFKSFNKNFDKIFKDSTENLMYFDQSDYLQNDILCKIDRASMYSSVEARVPFLDKNVFNIAWEINQKDKIRGNETKFILKKLLSKYINTNSYERPKKGFSIPLNQWLRHELKDWADDALSKQKINKLNFFDYTKIQYIWRNFLELRNDNGKLIWNLIILSKWINKI